MTRHQIMLEQVLQYLIAEQNGKAKRLLSIYLKEKAAEFYATA